MQRSPESKEDHSAETKPHDSTTGGTVIPQRKKFHNGWTRQLEQLVSEWADKSACYRWMHEKTEAKYNAYNMYFTIPVIILSTLTGTANFGIDSFLPDPSYGKVASAAIGGVSILTGIITTVANFLRYAQESEAHRVAGVSWGKFQRFISTELALHPNERMDAMSFLKMGRVELDRLIEQSPTIPTSTISLFEAEFKAKPEIKRPEIAGGIEHTRIFDDRESRVARIAAEAAFFLQQKRNYMKKLILEDFDKQIASRAMEERRVLEEDIMAEVLKAARETAVQTIQQRFAPPKPPVQSGPSDPREELQTIPPNVVNTAREKFEKKDVPPSMKSIAAEAAQVASARRAPSPNSVRLEILPE